MPELARHGRGVNFLSGDDDDDDSTDDSDDDLQRAVVAKGRVVSVQALLSTFLYESLV